MDLAGKTLDEALDIIETLPDEQQEMLIEVLRRRRIERWRKEVAKDARQAIEAFQAGKLTEESVEEIMDYVRTYPNDKPEE